jgi:hypothetical protein
LPLLVSSPLREHHIFSFPPLEGRSYLLISSPLRGEDKGGGELPNYPVPLPPIGEKENLKMSAATKQSHTFISKLKVSYEILED